MCAFSIMSLAAPVHPSPFVIDIIIDLSKSTRLHPTYIQDIDVYGFSLPFIVKNLPFGRSLESENKPLYAKTVARKVVSRDALCHVTIAWMEQSNKCFLFKGFYFEI